MKPQKLPSNSGRVNLYIDEEGQVSGDMFWNMDDNTSEEHVDVMVDALHGLMAMLTTRFDELLDLGKAFQAGASTQYQEVSMEPSNDDSEDLKLPDNVITLTSSNRKH